MLRLRFHSRTSSSASSSRVLLARLLGPSPDSSEIREFILDILKLDLQEPEWSDHVQE